MVQGLLGRKSLMLGKANILEAFLIVSIWFISTLCVL